MDKTVRGPLPVWETVKARAEGLLNEIEQRPLGDLLAEAMELRRNGHGMLVSYSRKVFIPLTQLCRDFCSYCTFAKAPSDLSSPYLHKEAILQIATAGRQSGCHEALFTLGDKPELRYPIARQFLNDHGYRSTAEYLLAMCELVHSETGLLPHINAGLMSSDEILQARAVSVSQGIMLENVSPRLGERGGPHYGSTDKSPRRRLEMIAAAGVSRVPFTSGILIGIGETRLERIASLISLHDLHAEYGHLQEVIVQNFRAKQRTRMAFAPEPDVDDLKWTVAVARLIFGQSMNIQVPPNLSGDHFAQLLDAGINDWGGISPVTPDHVNPEAPWPNLARLGDETERAGFNLVERSAIYPNYVREAEHWLDSKMALGVRACTDATGYIRDDDWVTGTSAPVPKPTRKLRDGMVDRVLERAASGRLLSESEIVGLFSARNDDLEAICAAADALRRQMNGDTVSYVVNRNINYTNVCVFKCGFCAFSKGRAHEHLRGKAYDLPLEEVRRRVKEAWDRGALEVCMQGGIHPHYTGETYLEILRSAKQAVPSIHVHAFSPLEVTWGAATLDISVRSYLEKLRDAGLGSLPGTAAEILDDSVRRIICPDKLSTQAWLDVIAEAHSVGLRTTATIMFGHVEQPKHWARHLLEIRNLQERTGGFTEFVPLPFVHMEAPLALRGIARKGPTWREVRLMHAVSRIVLHPHVPNIQASWVKVGRAGVQELLRGGVNDLGGTLMNESISRAAGAAHGQRLEPPEMEELIRSVGRTPQQRTTLYGAVPAGRQRASFNAAPLTETIEPAFKPLKKRAVSSSGTSSASPRMRANESVES